MRIAYLDCMGGMSADMALGALVDAGADLDEIQERLAALPIEPFELTREAVEALGVHATLVTVRPSTGEVIRTYASIRALLDRADLPDDVRNQARRIFERLAQAEARVHRKEIDLVTFHEFGEIDAIVAITGTVLALSLLGVERVFCSPVPTGMGMARTEHGAITIPRPSVVELLRGAPLYSRGVPVELVTPPGAAILATLTHGYGEVPLMRLDAAGYGAGTQRLDFPNVLRALIGEEQARTGAGARLPSAGDGEAEPGEGPGLVAVQADVRGVPPEAYTGLLERLFGAGAEDAWVTSVVRRGGTVVRASCLVPPEREDEVRAVLDDPTGTRPPEPPPVPSPPVPPPPAPGTVPDLRLIRPEPDPEP
ncbi:MAG: LarC family nickel insertion protein [Actinobacteria bacterium]|nr:LarC family nickel insertion protein [Actinomycetota bacterium]